MTNGAIIPLKILGFSLVFYSIFCASGQFELLISNDMEGKQIPGFCF
jgi:hypothetical protein